MDTALSFRRLATAFNRRLRATRDGNQTETPFGGRVQGFVGRSH